MTPERVAELRIDALNAKYAGKEFTIPASETMEILDLAMNQLEPRVTPEMWKNLGRIEALAAHTTSPVSELTNEQIIAIADRTKTAESRDGDYILPISFARAILAAVAPHAQAQAAPDQPENK